MNAKATPTYEATIQFREVTYSIDSILGKSSSRPIVSGVSMQVSQGETLVLLGRSGSGKTTLLRLINKLLVPSAGTVVVAGRATSEWDPIRLRRSIGYVIQEAGLFPHFTVSQNIALVPTLEKWDAARDSRSGRRNAQPGGSRSSRICRPSSAQLSGGQRQRVGVARALAADPPILLMDEPFGALDPVTRAELQREFSALARRLGKTIVFVTHDLREALLLASRIVLLQAGHIVAPAPPDISRHRSPGGARLCVLARAGSGALA